MSLFNGVSCAFRKASLNYPVRPNIEVVRLKVWGSVKTSEWRQIPWAGTVNVVWFLLLSLQTNFRSLWIFYLGTCSCFLEKQFLLVSIVRISFASAKEARELQFMLVRHGLWLWSRAASCPALLIQLPQSCRWCDAKHFVVVVFRWRFNRHLINVCIYLHRQHREETRKNFLWEVWKRLF